VRKIFSLLLVVGLSGAALAQKDQASWANLSGLRPGQKIQIVGVRSNKHSGKFVRVSDTAVSYSEATGEQSIPKQEVLSVKLLENNHRLRNTLIVAGGRWCGSRDRCSIAQVVHIAELLFGYWRSSPTGGRRRIARWRGGRHRRGSFTLSQHDLPREFALACFGSSGERPQKVVDPIRPLARRPFILCTLPA
jgi:hypothetical protein